MQQKKRMMLLLMIVMLIGGLLTACSPGDNKAAVQDGKNAATVDGTKKPPVIVTFWNPKGDDALVKDWFQKAVDDFNKTHDHIQVDYSTVPSDVWSDKLKSAQATGTAPDLLFENYSQVAAMAGQKMILPLNDYIGPEYWNDVLPNIKEFISVDDKYYAVPIEVEPDNALYYRKDFFIEVGLDPNKPPATWEELISYAKQLQTKNRDGFLAPASGGDLPWTHWGLMGMMKAWPISPDWSHSTIKQPAMKELITFWKRLIDEKIIPPQMPAPYWDPIAIAEGTAAMKMGGQWEIGILKNQYTDFDYSNLGVAPMPTPDGDTSRPTAAAGGWTVMVDANSKHPQEAAEFLAWFLLGDTERMVEYSNIAAKMPVRQSVLDGDITWKDDPNQLVFINNILLNSIAEPWYDYEIQEAYQKVIERSTLEKMSVEEALDLADKEINEIIARKGLSGTNPKGTNPN